MSLPSAEPDARIARHCICCGSPDLRRSPAILMPFVAARAFGWTPVEVTADWGLRDIKPGMAYPLCNSLQCRVCGLLFLDIRFDDAEMARLYADYRGPAYVAQREALEPGYAARNALLLAGSGYIPKVEALLSPYLPSRPAVLDWGGDTGVNTPFSATARTLHVYDISERPVIAGAARVDRPATGDNPYDLVVFSNVLEHVPRPRAALAEIAACMVSETVLYLEVPCEELVRTAQPGVDLAARRKYWHEHVNFFTEPALRLLVAAAGLHIVELQLLQIEARGLAGYVFAAVCKLA
jgi:hypothetical protein